MLKHGVYKEAQLLRMRCKLQTADKALSPFNRRFKNIEPKIDSGRKHSRKARQLASRNPDERLKKRVSFMDRVGDNED